MGRRFYIVHSVVYKKIAEPLENTGFMTPAKGVGWLKPARGFKSLLLRQLVASVISLATSYLCSALKTRPALILLLLASEPDSLRWIPVRVEKRKYPE